MNTPHAIRPARAALACVAATLLITGCATPPAYERPAAPVAAQWPGTAAASARSGEPASARPAWQDHFSDPALRQLITLALDGNRDLRVATLAIEQARAQYRIREADRLPTVNLAATGSRTPSGSGGITSLYNAGLTVTAWELDFFGRVASLKDAALAQYLASEEARHAAQTALVAAVASGYLNLLAGDELLALARQTLAAREASLQLVRLRFDNGASSELDLRQAESLTEAARVALAQATRQRALDENALVLLLGQPLPAGWRASADTQSLSLAELPAGLPSDLLVHRPDIRAAEQQLIAANANIGAARAAFFPRITLTAGVGTASKALADLFSGGSWGWTLAPQALLPIFDAGRNQAALDAAQAGRDIALAQYEKAIQTAFREVADALAGQATLGEQLRAQQAQADAEAARLRLAELRYQHGVASQLERLDAQRSLFAARQAVVQTRVLRLQNQVTLYKALGGGWTATPR